MNNKKEFNLLADLARLMHKYGPETFKALAQHISDQEFTNQLVELLNTTARVSRSAKRIAKKKSPKSELRSTLTNMAKSDTEKAALLIDLYDSLRNHRVLPTIRDMKNFAADNGLPPIKYTSREQALIPFVKSFLPLPVEDVRRYMERIRPIPSSDDRTLEGWSKIIFGKAARTNKN